MRLRRLDDYDPEASSDMEANVFAVDLEEDMSTRAARKEDAEDLARLNEHDRRKRQRKMMLESMAAEKRSKKRVPQSTRISKSTKLRQHDGAIMTSAM